MTSFRRVDDERPGALFWCGIIIAVLFATRTFAKALDAPIVIRLVLGIMLITALVVLAGVFVVGRLRGGVVAPRALAGVGGVALFLLGFMLLLDGQRTLVAMVVGLAAVVAVGIALAASFWD
jgi:hypothetical protein